MRRQHIFVWVNILEKRQLQLKWQKKRILTKGSLWMYGWLGGFRLMSNIWVWVWVWMYKNISFITETVSMWWTLVHPQFVHWIALNFNHLVFIMYMAFKGFFRHRQFLSMFHVIVLIVNHLPLLESQHKRNNTFSRHKSRMLYTTHYTCLSIQDKFIAVKRENFTKWLELLRLFFPLTLSYNGTAKITRPFHFLLSNENEMKWSVAFVNSVRAINEFSFDCYWVIGLLQSNFMFLRSYHMIISFKAKTTRKLIENERPE